MTTNLAALTLAQLRQALALKVEIEALQRELAALLATAAVPAVPASPAQAPAPTRKPSPAAPPSNGAAVPAPRAKALAANRHAVPRPRPTIPKEVPLLGLCLGADLPRPIRAGRRKAGG